VPPADLAAAATRPTGQLVGATTAARAATAVAAASPFLARVLRTDPLAHQVLANLPSRVDLAPHGDTVVGLARWKRLEMLRIAARDLLGLDDLAGVGAALSELADDICVAALDLAGRRSPKGGQMAIIGMGKLGAQELNYSSDIDLVLVGSGNAGPVLDILRTCWRIDLGLRPEGRDGPVIRSLASFQVYWERWAQTWEFQALLKARAVAGDAELSARFIEAAGAQVWERPFGADDLRQLRAMKARAEGHLARNGGGRREVKLGPGGIRDVEFALQLLQLVHGRADRTLRVPATLPALAALSAGGYVAPEDATPLRDGYRFLRTVEHRLQLWEDQAVRQVPADRSKRAGLARNLGFLDEPVDSALAKFDRQLRAHQAAVRPIYERLFFRPLLEAFTVARPGIERGPTLSDAAVTERLSAFGFSDARRTRQAIGELTQGFSRSSALLSELLPLLLDWLSSSPDPDLGLLGLRSLTTTPHSRDRLTEVCRESLAGARQLCELLGTGPQFVRTLKRYPDALAGLVDGRTMAHRTHGDLVDGARQAIAWRTNLVERQAALAHYANLQRLGIATRDVLGLDDVAATGRSLTSLAESVLTAALQIADPQVPFALIGMGRLGGAELAYGSDLDLLLVYDGDDPGGRGAVAGAARARAREAERVATTLLRVIGGATPAGRIFAVDTSLRPEGRVGPLARSVDAFGAYYERWAHVGERQALLRGRAVAGDPEVVERFAEVAQRFLWGTPLDATAVRDIRRMKARIERERIPAGEDPQFHLKLGRGSLSDIEWTAQLLQLRHHVVATGTVEALEGLAANGALNADDTAVLIDAYRFCEATRNRLHLVRGTPGEALPATGPLLAALARSLATTPAELRDTYRRHTRRARRVVERVFYGVH
jgi:glutamate-ammonia-ligase adenylyltransferase